MEHDTDRDVLNEPHLEPCDYAAGSDRDGGELEPHLERLLDLATD